MIRALFYTGSGELQKDAPLAQVPHLLEQPHGLIWVSLEQPTDEELDAVLRDIFHFHPLAVEDCASYEYQPPKVDDFGDYIFLIVHALRADFDLNRLSGELDTIELNCFISQRYLVTSYRSAPIASIEKVWNGLDRNLRPLERGVDFLCHAILDDLVDEYLPLIDAVDEEIDQIEDAILADPQTQTLQRILALKHNMVTLRRIISPQREVINRLSRDDLPQISAQNRIYFRNIYDHLVRLHDLSESIRDVIGGTLDTYMSVTSNRLNQIMRTLAVISTIFLPLSFLTGVYGMNFDYIPILHWQYGFAFIWAVFLMVVTGMLWIFKRNNWF